MCLLTKKGEPQYGICCDVYILDSININEGGYSIGLDVHNSIQL